jgi:hypothetical protein
MVSQKAGDITLYLGGEETNYGVEISILLEDRYRTSPTFET